MGRLQFLLAGLALLHSAAAPSQEPFDGIAATVNGEIISIGEVRRAALLARENKLGLGALCEGQPNLAAELVRGEVPDSLARHAEAGVLATAELERARECLIDTRLIFREVRRFPRITATETELDAMMATLVEEFGSAAALTS